MGQFMSSVVTVGKVILIALMGIYASRNFGNKKKTLKALSYIAVKIFLPCLLLSQLATDISWDMIRTYYWACILPFIPMVIGVASAFAFRSFIPAEFHGLLQLACTFQNVITYGLSITSNLDISWCDSKAKREAQSYVFLYNVVHSLFLWSVGMMIIEKCALALEEENELAARAAFATTHIHSVETEAKASAPLEGAENASPARYQPLTRLEDYRPLPELTTNATRRRVRRLEDTSWPEYIVLHLSYLCTEQLIFSFIGLLIALVPPFGLLVRNPVGEALLGGIKLLAGGAVPLKLLVLGINILAESEGSVELPLRFIICVIALRLFFIPLVCFGVVHLLVVNALMPYDRPFILVMLVLTSAPTAINTSIICSMYSYKVKEYTKLLISMYLSCIFTTTAWLTVYAWYLEPEARSKT
ncbi:putative transporter [Trypanosoma grayi]|uniref:putative transporter n=1 Tax=Trypanosoma grayi TaxID=71804 RepID=UPI0004F4A3AD|nr:putative transporter [Trypanosoma grayi]KEG12645.1 putative transporter [Trypanosoma grayi]